MRCKNTVAKVANLIASVALVATASILQVHESAGADLPGTGKTVKAVDDGLIEGRMQTEIVNIGLARLGYQIAPVVSLAGPPAIYVALGQGEADFTAVGWQPQNTAAYEKAGGDASMTQVGVLVEGAAQGFQIDKATSEKYGITNIAQLRDPKLAKLFDSDGDGKANLAGCPPGWGCEKVVENLLDKIGLRDTITDDQGEFVPIHADVVARYKAHQSVLFYTYVPMWLSEMLVPGVDVVWLESPDIALPYDTSGRSVSTKLPDGRNLGFEIQVIKIIANNNFLAHNPAAKRLMEEIRIPLQDVNSENLLIYKGENTAENVHGHAVAWVAKHKDQFDSWVNEALAVSQ